MKNLKNDTKTENIKIRFKHISELTVTGDVTAIAMKCGDVTILAIPAIIALMENAAMLFIAEAFPEGFT